MSAQKQSLVNYEIIEFVDTPSILTTWSNGDLYYYFTDGTPDPLCCGDVHPPLPVGVLEDVARQLDRRDLAETYASFEAMTGRM